MKNPESHIGTWGWAAIGTFVVAWDIFAPETLSGAVDRALEHPIGKYAAIGGVAITGAHLLNIYDRLGITHLDPILAIGNFAERVVHNVREI